MFWFNFILGSNFILFLGMVMYDNAFFHKKNLKKQRKKIKKNKGK